MLPDTLNLLVQQMANRGRLGDVQALVEDQTIGHEWPAR